MKKSHPDGWDCSSKKGNRDTASCSKVTPTLSEEMLQPQLDDHASQNSPQGTEILKDQIKLPEGPSPAVDKDKSDATEELQKDQEFIFSLEVKEPQKLQSDVPSKNSISDEVCPHNLNEDPNANQLFESNSNPPGTNEANWENSAKERSGGAKDPIQSTLKATPPYEYLILPPGHENKFRIYLNPRIDKSFYEILHKQSYDLNNSLPPSAIPSEVSSSNPKQLPFTTSSIVSCFDPSEVDMELKQLLIIYPPVTNSVVRKRPRYQRGSSVPAIDSYYGCDDLEKVGHASYFIPLLTASERKAVGWKDDYKYGKWKYSTPNLSNNTKDKVASGSVLPLSAVPSTILKSTSSWWKRAIAQHNNNITSALSATSQSSILSQSQTALASSRSIEVGYKNNSGSICTELNEGEGFVMENPSTVTLIGSGIEGPNKDNRLANFSSINHLKRRLPLAKFFCWLIPKCLRTLRSRQKSSITKDEWEEGDPTFPGKLKTSESSMEQLTV